MQVLLDMVLLSLEMLKVPHMELKVLALELYQLGEKLFKQLQPQPQIHLKTLYHQSHQIN